MHIIGASGHGKVILDILQLNRVSIDGIWDDNGMIKEWMGFELKGSIRDCINNRAYPVIIAVGKNGTRKEIAEKFRSSSIFGKAIHPSAVISNNVKIGVGSVVMANASINSSAQIGNHVIINTNASVDHDCIIGDYVHISPQAGLAGNVAVGEGTHIGIGAHIIQGINIGSWCTVGAGAVIIRDIPDRTTVVGNPGRIIKQNYLRG